MTLTSEARPPAARELRTRLARTRRARRRASVIEERDWYTPTLAAIVVGGVLVQGVRRLAGTAEVAGPAAPHLPLLLAAALIVLAGLALRAAVALGPVLAGPAARHWVLASPVDRGALLTPRYAAAGAAAVVAGAATGAVAGLVAGCGVPWWALGGGAAGACVVAAGVLFQSAQSGAAPGRLTGGIVVGAGAVVAVVALLLPPDVAAPAEAGPVSAGCFAVTAAALLTLAWRRLGRLDRATLAAGSGLAAAVRMAGVFLDPDLLLGLIEERRWAAARRGPSRAGVGTAAIALLHADLRRVLRTPGALPLAVLLLLVPYAGSAVLPAAAVLALTSVVVWVVASRVATGLRTVTRSAALRRAVGLSDRVLRVVHLVAPLAAAVLWTGAALPALVPVHPLAVVLLPVGAVAVVERAAARREPDLGAPVFETGFGALPVAAIGQMLVVPGLLALLAGLQLLLAV